MIKKLFIALLLTFITGVGKVHAQLNLYGVYYYIEAGKELSDNTKVHMLYFDGDSMYLYATKASEISAKLYSDSTYWSTFLTTKGKPAKYQYNSSLSTSSNEVYSGKRYGQGYLDYLNCPPGCMPQWVNPVIGTNYFAISNDLETVIFWYESKSSNEVQGKKHYIRVPESDLDKDPYDFLK